MIRLVMLALSLVLLFQGIPAQAVDEPIHAREVWRTELTYPPETTISNTDIYSFAWSPDQSQLLVLVCGTLFVLRGDTGEIVMQVPVGDAVVEATDGGEPINCPTTQAAWSSDSTHIAITRWWDGIQIVSVPTGEPSLLQTDLPPTSDRVDYLSISFLLALYRDVEGYFIGIWDTVSQDLIYRIPARPTDGYTGMVIRDGVALIPQRNGTIRQIALPSGEELQMFRVSQDAPVINVPYLDPSERYILYGYREGDIEGLALYDVQAQESHLLVEDTTTAYPLYVGKGWSPDGNYFVSTAITPYRTLTIWDLQTLSSVMRIEAYAAQYGAVDVQWRSDSNAILLPNGVGTPLCEIYGCSTTAQVMAVPSGEVTHVLQGHQKTVNYALWSADGTRIVTASEDGTVRLWDLTQEADYPGCDPSNQFLPGTLVWFALRDDGLSGYATPGDEEAVTSLNNNRPYVVSDGPRCIDGVDWYQVTPQLLEDDGDLLLRLFQQNSGADRGIERNDPHEPFR